MSNVKISQLSDAGDLTGDERLPVVQAGQTVGATVDQIRAGLLPMDHAGGGGTVHATVVPNGAAGFLSGADKAKLDGIQASATANSADSQLRDRATHTGTQPLNSITGLGSMATQAAGSVAITGGTATFSTLTTTGAATLGNGAMITGKLAAGSEPGLGASSSNGISIGAPAGEAVGVQLFQAATGLGHLGIPGGSGALLLVNSYFSGTLTGGNGLAIDISGNVAPTADNTRSLGSASHRWSEIYSGTGTINTSDARDKEAITPVDPVLATALMRAIDPVTFKWRAADPPAVAATCRVVRQKTREVNVVRDVVERMGDKFIRRRVEETLEVPVFSEHQLHDETGAPLFDSGGSPILHLEADLEEIDGPAVTAPTPTKVNQRTHWGFVAQQVEEGLCGALGLDRGDPTQLRAARQRFAGLIHDDASGRYGLRDTQFTPILWTVLRGVLDRIEALEARLPA